MLVNMARAISRVEQGEETAKRLVEVALSLFGQRGYADVSAEEIVQRAGLTRGALYHHFDGKRGLFEAVLVDCERRIVRQIQGAAGQREAPKDQLLAGSLAFLDACADPELQRIVIQEAPAVLGWSEWRRIDEAHGFALLQGAIERLEVEGVLNEYSSDALAYLLSGAMNELAMWIAQSSKPRTSLTKAKKTLTALLNRIES